MSTATSISPDNSQEQDISHPWPHDDSYTQLDSYPSKRKGKERESGQEPHTPETSSERVDLAYPPTTEDAEETRRVEENLRRWEIAERQRRKAARESMQGSTAPSVLGDVSRRASLLWANRTRNKHPSMSLAMPVALHSEDNIDVVPLTHATASPASSPTRTTSQEMPQNPFNPPQESLSPFADSYRIQPTPDQSDTNTPNHPPVSNQPPHVDAESLPESRISSFVPSITPDARSTPEIRITQPPRPMTPPDSDSSCLGSGSDLPSEKPVRWWHDWLCGCSEGTDRGGDHQAGRTNPFE